MTWEVIHETDGEFTSAMADWLLDVVYTGIRAKVFMCMPLIRSRWTSETLLRKQLQTFHPAAVSGRVYDAATKSAAAARLGEAYERAAVHAPFSVQPLLAYYALLHWTKAILYAADLTYPPSASVLQHGLSVRRVKRSLYHWSDEVIHIYKEGVLQSFCAYFKRSYILPSKWSVGDLLGLLPRLVPLLTDCLPARQHVFPLWAEPGHRPLKDPTTNLVWVTRQITTQRELTVEEWLKEYAEAFRDGQSPEACAADIGIYPYTKDIEVSPAPPGWLAIPAPTRCHPWVTWDRGYGYICDALPPPQHAVHYALLYSLSSICRYNPAEWLEIVHYHNEQDALLVRSYLEQYPLADMVDNLLEHVSERILQR
ncbi:MAG: YaaC family protein [Alicyclobacillus sp.]|nr:YaaC family protein [Alicyclobacillus sp.]